MTDPQTDPETPLEELTPVDVQEVDEPGPEPDDGWGEDGQGGDTDGDTGDGQ